LRNSPDRAAATLWFEKQRPTREQSKENKAALSDAVRKLGQFDPPMEENAQKRYGSQPVAQIEAGKGRKLNADQVQAF
jgi:hypothetical protein